MTKEVRKWCRQQHSRVTRGRKDTQRNIHHSVYQKSRRIVGVSEKKTSGTPERFDKDVYA